MTVALATRSALKLIAIASFAAAILLCAVVATSLAQTSTPQTPTEPNLLVNGDLKAGKGGVPEGWKVHSIPDCGFSYLRHKHNDGADEFEIINDEPVESMLQQQVQLKPGWYSFTAEIKIETLGSAGSAPELFVKSAGLPVQTRVHPVGFTNDWRKYQVLFSAGPKVPEVVVGCALGSWGSPNSGRLLFRNPSLVRTEETASTKKSIGLEAQDNHDLEAIAETRYPSLSDAAAAKPVPVSSTQSVLNGRWTMGALSAGLLLVAILGWRGVSPSQPRQPRA